MSPSIVLCSRPEQSQLRATRGHRRKSG